MEANGILLGLAAKENWAMLYEVLPTAIGKVENGCYADMAPCLDLLATDLVGAGLFKDAYVVALLGLSCMEAGETKREHLEELSGELLAILGEETCQLTLNETNEVCMKHGIPEWVCPSQSRKREIKVAV